MEENQIRFLRVCESLAAIHDAFILAPTRKELPDLESNPWSGLKDFLGYAFERQGKADDYPAIAVWLAEKYSQERKPITQQTGKEFWEEFERELKDHGHTKGVNARLNPLAPKGTKYELKRKGETHKPNTRERSIFELIEGEGFTNISITTWAADSIKKSPKKAREKLAHINGISNKIASLYLRDIALLKGIEPVAEERYCLQPIDVWLRYLGAEIWGVQKSDEDYSKLYADLTSHNLNPEKINMGIWFLSVQVCGSSWFSVKKAMCDSKYRNCLLDKLKSRYVSAADAVKINPLFNRNQSEG